MAFGPRFHDGTATDAFKAGYVLYCEMCILLVMWHMAHALELRLSIVRQYGNVWESLHWATAALASQGFCTAESPCTCIKLTVVRPSVLALHPGRDRSREKERARRES